MPRRSSDGPRLYRKAGSRYWWCDTYEAGRRVRFSTRETDQAKALAVARKRTTSRDPASFTVEDALKLRHQDLKLRLALGEARPNTVEGFETAQRAILNGLDGRMLAAEVTRELVAEFLVEQRGRKRKHTGLKGPLSYHYLSRMVRELRAALRLSFKRKRISVPVHEELGGLLKCKPPEVDVLTAAEREALIQAAKSEWLRRFLIIADASGPRISELVGARRAGVEFSETAQRATISVQQSKTGHPRRLNLRSARAIRALREQMEASSAEFLFSKPDGEPYSENRVQNLVREALKDIGAYKPYRGVHSLRRSLVTDMIRDGAPIEHTAAIVGHRSLQVTKDHYAAANILEDRASDSLARVRQ